MFDVDKLLISRFGRSTYEKGLNYLGDVYLNDSTTNGNLRYYKFSVESERFFNHYYSVVVIIHNNDIFRYGCNCPEFVKNHKCKHILASIINYKSQMFNRSQEDINIESTREILEFFKNNSITNNIKEKLNLDLELDFSYNRKTVYLAVGLNKTYVIKTERKLEDFMDAYYKKYPYKFGVKFTYDSNKHFFSDEDKKILEFLFEYKKSERNYYYYQTLDPFELNEREFKMLLNLIKDKKINIKDYGYVSEIKEGIPTNLTLNYLDNKYELYFDDINKYKILDEDCKYIAYNNILYIIPSDIAKLINMCEYKNIEKLTFDKENLNLFKNGLLSKIKNCVKLTDNVKEIFDANKITSYVITGSVKSKDRMNYVDKFNKDDTNCFLITLKAGGTGLNLTGADIVIHLDIWWNPQVENQATDRTHRIGQKNKVTVVRLITKGTIEERIIELQNKKKVLSENLIEGKDNSSTISTLTEEEIKQLLSYGADN